jgi:hypothetical protein
MEEESSMNWIIEIIAGLIGGNSAGAAAKQYSLGPVGNSIAGLLGGVGVGQILGLLVPALSGATTSSAGSTGGGMSIEAIIGQLVGGGIGGAVLTLIIGLIKQKMAGGAVNR